MNKVRSVFSVASFALVSTTIALAGCTIDGFDGQSISIGDTGGSVETCVEECRTFANQCGFDDTCEKACAMIEDAGCLDEVHDLQECKEDGADLCKAPQCQAEAEASIQCMHGYCEKNPGAEGC